VARVREGGLTLVGHRRPDQQGRSEGLIPPRGTPLAEVACTNGEAVLNFGMDIVRGFRSTVGSGVQLPGLRWFFVVLLVISLTVTHACSVLGADNQQEVHMVRTNKNQALKLFLKQVTLSFITTMWAIETSAVAGALST
jgi:hypothetical protein